MDRLSAQDVVIKRRKRKRMGRSGPTKLGVARQPQETMSDRFRMEQRRRLMNKKRDNLPGGMLSGGQAKLDKNKNNKIDAQDFKILRAEKAKGRGMGLQDEKMKPGKVKKAVIGMLALGAAGALGAKKLLGKKKSAKAKVGDVSKGMKSTGFGKNIIEMYKKQKLGTPGIAGPVMRRGGILKADKGGMTGAQYRKYLKGLKDVKEKAENKKFEARRMRLAGGKAAMNAIKASRAGKIAAGVAGAALLAKAGLEKMYEKRTGKKPFTKREKKRTLVDKKMGGGMMMQRPMGYSKGTMMDDIVENMGKDYDYQTRIKFRKKSKGAPDQDPMKAMSEAEVDAAKSVKKKYTGKMGGGLTEATQRLKAQGKMGGGMMMRPNPVGMKSGKSVKVKCKLGRNKPTKMY
jgi:hypothetical protein